MEVGVVYLHTLTDMSLICMHAVSLDEYFVTNARTHHILTNATMGVYVTLRCVYCILCHMTSM